MRYLTLARRNLIMSLYKEIGHISESHYVAHIVNMRSGNSDAGGNGGLALRGSPKLSKKRRRRQIPVWGKVHRVGNACAARLAISDL